MAELNQKAVLIDLEKAKLLVSQRVSTKLSLLTNTCSSYLFSTIAEEELEEEEEFVFYPARLSVCIALPLRYQDINCCLLHFLIPLLNLPLPTSFQSTSDCMSLDVLDDEYFN
ncbi:hypothetical protein T05_15496 [Trichinella murrelli]|uniref:Uncharacterized protein n=1 Tax=Trichinella murrelli TaxID=144512 RepID=A0A0V0TNV1_9BILA|nr:hypothetical protein T05_15496 [Trichinella murrelli]